MKDGMKKDMNKKGEKMNIDKMMKQSDMAKKKQDMDMEKMRKKMCK